MSEPTEYLLDVGINCGSVRFQIRKDTPWLLEINSGKGEVFSHLAVPFGGIGELAEVAQHLLKCTGPVQVRLDEVRREAPRESVAGS